jgi:hypothetical protein
VKILIPLAALLLAPLADADGPDSFNVRPALVGNPRRAIRDHAVLAPNKKANLALREGRWLYIGAQGGGGFAGTKVGERLLGGPTAIQFTGEANSDIADGKLKPGAPTTQLHDLEADPAQSCNVTREYSSQAALMAKRLAELQRQSRTAPPVPQP